MERLLIMMTVGASTVLITECFNMCDKKKEARVTEIIGGGSLLCMGLSVVKEIIIGAKIL